MKIALSQRVTGLAGSEKYLLELCPALKAAGLDVHFILLYDHEDNSAVRLFLKTLHDQQVPVHAFQTGKIPSLRSAKQLRRFLAAEQFDLVHTHLIYSDLLFALLLPRCAPATIQVSTKHGYSEAYNNKYGFDVHPSRWQPYRILAAWAERRIKRSFAVSHALRALFVGQGICAADRIDVIHHGFDYEPVAAPPREPHAPRRLVMVGRLSLFKGHRFAFAALKQLLPHYPDLRLSVAGTGPIEADLRALATELGIAQAVDFLGFQDRPRELVAGSDVALVPSVAEAFGLVILEIMTTGTPVVAWDVPSPNEILTDGESGMLAPPFEVDAFAAKIRQLLDAPDAAARMGVAAQAVQRRDFNKERMVTDTIRFYHRSLEA